jgi:hypothetical protein
MVCASQAGRQADRVAQRQTRYARAHAKFAHAHTRTRAHTHTHTNTRTHTHTSTYKHAQVHKHKNKRTPMNTYGSTTHAVTLAPTCSTHTHACALSRSQTHTRTTHTQTHAQHTHMHVHRNPQSGVPMTTTAVTWPAWTVTVELPAGQIVEYKFATGIHSQKYPLSCLYIVLEH